LILDLYQFPLKHKLQGKASAKALAQIRKMGFAHLRRNKSFQAKPQKLLIHTDRNIVERPKEALGRRRIFTKRRKAKATRSVLEAFRR